jgi:hypothetical protein
MVAASKALLKLRDILNESTADPSLLGLSFSPVMREFGRFVSEAWSPEPIDANAYGGRGHVLKILLGGTPRKMGWSKGGRLAATWLNRTEADLREHGLKGEALKDILDAAGLTGTPPKPKPKHNPKSSRRRKKPKAVQGNP